ncbi:glycosyltransferase [Poseidonibacter ostreae]|uniref:glycosyltransferase family 2 protein n=1 Tax=Poseidonibacter ostreae TaxID=2654171 RepID=UPI00126538F2|nr:glycosyltransferase family 2 protein [Poseidonibacter ostreae]KAB7881206.1 glycosyltransferase [Poseidonibacter ostreae]
MNEELHIARCIESLQNIAEEIFIVDSYSTDKTVEIAQSLGAKVYQNKWTNYAIQYQWGLDNCPIKTEWVMRMDADEYILAELEQEINSNIENVKNEVSGIYIKRRVYFKDKWIKHGSYYPTWLLRIWRYKDGHIEQRWMDEHIKLTTGETIQFENDLVDDNLNDLTWWTEKHNNYATREAVDILNIIHEFLKYDEVPANLFGSQEERKRYLKKKYANLPLFTRPFLYFMWRYFIKLGFLDGKQGLIWHFLQGFWYRFLVDAKIYEMEKKAKDLDLSIKEVLIQKYGFKL